MATPAFDNIEKSAALQSFLHRQIFKAPTLPKNVNLKGTTAILTGSNTLGCARQLLDLGASKLIVASLDQLHIAVLNAGVSKQFLDLTPSTSHEDTIQPGFYCHIPISKVPQEFKQQCSKLSPNSSMPVHPRVGACC
ncbi:hypothetical protein F5Y12DRAFT_709783 [Xylaria sp. FL1777]|nr:hypothetical protein F5Y12DRAFT_709783 [Xylaria sp. FL1777]